MSKQDPTGTAASRISPRTVVDVLRSCLPGKDDFIPLHVPRFEGNEWKYVKECIDTAWVSSVGSYVDRFEKDLAEYTGAERAVAVVNGTSALQVALRLAGVKTGDEVLVPALTFVATANAVSYLGATPHFVDCEERTLGMDPSRLEGYLNSIAECEEDGCYNRKTGQRIAAVVPMHAYGHPVDLAPLVEVCQSFDLPVVEDAAESLGSLYRGAHTGQHGTLGVISFNGNKTITTGGGGAILTNDKDLADRAKHLTTTAKKDHRWAYHHDEIGYNYRLPNINAALGCAQLEQLPHFIERKRALAARYQEAFADICGVTFFEEPSFARSNYWLNALLLDNEIAHQRDEFLEATNDAGFMTRPAWTLMHKLPMYSDNPRMDLPVAESIEQRLLNIPSSPHLASEDVRN